MHIKSIEIPKQSLELKIRHKTDPTLLLPLEYIYISIFNLSSYSQNSHKYESNCLNIRYNIKRSCIQNQSKFLNNPKN